jgi:hypothetical protein
MSKTGNRCVFRVGNAGGEDRDVPARQVDENQMAFEAELSQLLTPFDPREISLVDIDTGDCIARFKLDEPDEGEEGPVVGMVRDREHHYLLRLSLRVDRGRIVALKHVRVFPDRPEDDEEDED